MKRKFKIVNEHISSISYRKSATGAVYLGQEPGPMNAQFGLHISPMVGFEEASRASVKISVDFSPVLHNSFPLFTLNLDYCVVADFRGTLTPKQKETILCHTIPRIVYPRIRKAARQITSKIGFGPVILSEDPFNMTSPTLFNRLTFENLIGDLERAGDKEAGYRFLQMYRDMVGPLDCLDDFNLERCVFQFQEYTDYAVCPELQDDVVAKQLMFHFIATVEDMKWHLEKVEGQNLPELVVKHELLDGEKLMSNIGPREFYEMGSWLFTHLLTETSIQICNIENEVQDFDDSEVSGDCPSITEYREAFGFPDLSEVDLEIVDELYGRIHKTHEESFLLTC